MQAPTTAFGAKPVSLIRPPTVLTKGFDQRVVAQRHQRRHVTTQTQRLAHRRVTRAAETAATLQRPFSDEPDSLRLGVTPKKADKALALSKRRTSPFTSNAAQHLGHCHRAQARNAGQQRGVLGQVWVGVNVIINLLLQRLDAAVQPIQV
jgi:hypothetical protein